VAAPPRAERLRLSELIAAISLAIDLATGQPMDHALRTCRLATALAQELGLDPGTTTDVYYFALLRFLGCTADAPEMAHLAGGDNLEFFAGFAPVYMGSTGEGLRAVARGAGRGQPPARRARLFVETLRASRSEVSHCEVGARLAARLGLGSGVIEALGHAYERWDGRGLPDGLAGEAVPIVVRVVVVARDAVLWHRLAGTQAALEVLARRRGAAYDPAVVDAVPVVGLTDGGGSPWDEVLAAEPAPVARVDAEGVGRALAAVGDFTDLRSTWTRGRSTRLARTARRAGEACGLRGAELTALAHAALVADVGTVGVPAGVWQRAGPLDVAGTERVRLHPYLSERVLGRCTGLGSVAELAGAHHERLDGSGYHRGTAGGRLSRSARLLAAADVWTALGEDRPHRPALSRGRARDLLWAEVAGGRLDAAASEAVLAASDDTTVHRSVPRPAGLSDREVEVLRLIARGHSNREVAGRLWISTKTVGHHVEHIYAKVGVRTRPAAALFAMENGLLDR
jgi:HD-GYP domain-containing protein (c-di-GMP phosphodiesterase class II)